MKKNKYLTLAAATLMLAACSNNDAPQADALKDTPIIVTAGVAELITRAGYETPENGDAVLPETFYLGIDQTGTNYDYPNMKMIISGTTYTPESPLLWAGGTENVTVTAATFSLEGAQTLAVQVDQNTTDGVKNSDHLLMAANMVEPSANGISVNFSHIMAKVILTITLDDEFNEEKNPISNVTFKGTLDSRSYDRTTETHWSDISGVTAADITPLFNAYTAPTTDKPNATAEYEVILVPQTVAANDFTVQFSVGERMFAWTSTKEVKFEDGNKYTLALTAGDSKVTLGSITASKWTTSSTGGELTTE